MKRALAAVILAAGGWSACAYFNALYNAERRFADARRAEARGDARTAKQMYETAIHKAAKALRQDPDGRWADDALYLIGRAHFSLGDDRAAAAALGRTLETADEPSTRAGAHAYLGAAHVQLAAYPDGLRHLDAALDGDEARPEVRAFARLWRARARFALGEDSAAWEDLVGTAAARDAGVVTREARLEWLRRSVLTDDPDRAVAAAAALLGDPAAHRWADSLLVWVDRASERWGAGRAQDLLAAIGAAAWPVEARDRLALRRAELAAEDGRVDRAIDEVRELAGRGAGATAGRARVLWARWLLARARSPADLEEVREVLLPVIDDPGAERLIRSLRVATTLIARAESGDAPLTWFAAAELARDRLEAPALARVLFLRYADAAPDSAWAPKALLAAAALAESPAQVDRIRARLNGRYRGNVYLTAVSGVAPVAAFAEAERRLEDALAALSAEARRRAERRDVVVTQALVAIDSVRAAALADSLREACTSTVDSLALRGPRADSVRAACVRRDSLRMDSLLLADTVVADTSAEEAPPWIPLDTTGASTAPAALALPGVGR